MGAKHLELDQEIFRRLEMGQGKIQVSCCRRLLGHRGVQQQSKA